MNSDFFNENDYHIPQYHVHKEFKVIKNEIKDIDNKIEEPNIFAFDSSLREREPELFGKASSPKKSSIKRPKLKIADDDFFGDE